MSTCQTATVSDILSYFPVVFTRSFCQAVLTQAGIRRFWRALTPLVVLVAMIYQRLNSDHTCDAALTFLRHGGLDHLDEADAHSEPLSARLISDNTSAYVQARQRLPLVLVQAVFKCVCRMTLTQLPPSPLDSICLLDGTTFRIRPKGDLLMAYGQASNQHGKSYCAIAKSVAAFCVDSRLCLGYVEGPHTASDPSLAAQLIRQCAVPGQIFIGDAGFGVYRVAQVAAATHQHVILRLEGRVARRLWRLAQPTQVIASGQEIDLIWLPNQTAKTDPDLPVMPIPGRLGFVRLERPGFRPIDLYLFTTLLDSVGYPVGRLIELYGLRWQVELRYREVKTTLTMSEFDVQSAELFRLELAVGLLAYNLVCALMCRAATSTSVPALSLSFSKCRRRVWQVFAVATLVPHRTNGANFIAGLAQCRLPNQPNKVKHEPRKKRPRPPSFPDFRETRQEARQKIA